MIQSATTNNPARVSPQKPSLIKRRFHIFVRSLKRAANRYNAVNGEQCAASFAYYAFFSLFPLILLAVAIGTFFVRDPLETAEGIVKQLEMYTPLQQHDRALLLDTVLNVLNNGWRAGLLSMCALLWGSLRFFQALVIGINRAWRQPDYDWWRLPLKNLLMTVIFVVALVLGVLTPAIFDHLKTWWPALNLDVGLNLTATLFPAVLLYLGILTIFRLAPRHRSRLRHIWMPALITTILLKFSQVALTWYLNTFNSNAVYGVFGSLMGLLLWIYVSGVIMIFGGCLCATGHAIVHFRVGRPRFVRWIIRPRRSGGHGDRVQTITRRPQQGTEAHGATSEPGDHGASTGKTDHPQNTQRTQKEIHPQITQINTD
ncbi:MAG: YihY/virulence factor BrkB family protein [Verrucomicrobia bacterium]|nr:YihY/virulence factor BrkB family protein [Verrucomicrobiota bacterium]